MLDVIKSYLVGLGFQVNQSEFAKAQGAINDLGRTVQTATAGMAKNFATAATGVVAALTTINTATAGLVTQVANADMQYQKFALRLWTTKETAKELKMTLEAMGEDMEDVAWLPELRQQYAQLIQQGRQMQTPGDASDQLKYVRSIMFEFKRMKLEVQYVMEWVSYYLIKYLGGPLSGIKKQLGDFNDKLTATMPEWTKKIAKVLATLMNVGIAGARFVKELYDGVVQFFDMIPKGAKIALAAILGIWAVLRLNPIGQIMIAILLLIEDFYGYLDGRKSSKNLAPIWRELIAWFEKVKPLIAEFAAQIAGAWESLKVFWSELKKSDGYALSIKILKDLFVLLKETIQSLKPLLAEAFGEIFKSIAKNGVLDSFKNMFYEIGKAIDDIFNSLTKVMKQLGLLSSSPKYKGFWSWFGDELSRELKRLADFGTILAKLVQLNWAIMGGKFKEAGDISKSILGDVSRVFGSGGDHGSTRSWGGGEVGNQEMMALAQRVSQKTGLPAQWIYGQWYHESGGFTSQLSRENYNFGGLTQVEPNGEENKQPDGSNYYMKFNSPEAYADYYAKLILKFGGERLLRAQTAEEFAQVLRDEQYYTADPREYATGIKNGMSTYAPETNYANSYNAQPSSYTPTAPVSLPAYTQAYAPAASNYANSSSVTVGDIYVTQPNATPVQIQQAVTEGVQQAQDRTIARQSRELGTVFV